MTTNRTSWETMQRKQLALSCAKDAKALHAQELEKLRLTLEYLRSLRQWVSVASSHRTLKARKLALTEYQNRPAMMEGETAALTVCYWDLVPANCQENIRSAISWAYTATSSTTFKDWQECCDSAGDCISDAICQVDVVLSRVKSSWKQARANMVAARTVIDTCAKDILHPVALSKQAKVDTIRLHVLKFTSVPLTVAQCTKANLYKLARYHHAKNTTKPSIPFKVWSIAVAVDTSKVICLR